MTKLFTPICFIACATLICVSLHGVVYADAGSGSSSAAITAPADAGVPVALDAGAAATQSDAGSAVAPIAPAPPELNPIASLGDGLTIFQKLYRAGAWLCIGILVAFELLLYASKTWGWFEPGGKGAAYTAAALGGLALLIVPAVQGTTPNAMMLFAAAGTAYALLRHPVTPQQTAKPAAT